MFVKYLFHFYFVAFYLAVANGLIVKVKVIVELNSAQATIYNVDCADVLWSKAC